MADSQDECVQNSFEVSAAMFSLDLVAASYQHVQFLKRVHQAGLSLRAPTAEEFRRYEQLWLPLLASASENVTLCPPLDVAWLWHCHRLAPASYARACVEIFGASHALDCPAGAFQAAEQASYNQGVNVACVEQTQALWMKMYPHEPFFPTERSDQKVNAETGAPWIAEAVATVGNNGAGQTYGVISGFDVVESCERQATFLWQMSGPRYSDPAFLQEGVLNYARFLNLMKLNPKAFAVPTYQIDLMWHTHMLASSAAYHRDAGALTGRRSGPNHDDSVNDRSHAATKLNVCTATTKQLWKRAYGQDYFCPGGMFRGDPPSEYWHRAWQPTVPGPALVNAAIAKSTGVVSQQPVSAETLLHDAICSDADVVGADSESIITSMADCLGMRPASPRAVLGGAPPGEAITDATVTEVKAPFNSARSDAVVAQAIVVPSTTIYGCDANWLKTQPPFIKAAQKSTTKNVNANPQRTGYVFGQVQLNEGYWRLDTTQADEVIVRKLTGRLNTLLASGDNRDKALAELPLKIQQLETSLSAGRASNSISVSCCFRSCLECHKGNLETQLQWFKLQADEISVLLGMLADESLRKSTRPNQPSSTSSSTSSSAACGAGACGGFSAMNFAACGGGGDSSGGCGGGGCGSAACGGGGSGCGSTACDSGDSGGGGCGGGGCGGCGGGPAIAEDNMH